MANSILRITDGTETVNLLDLHGWILQDWSPAVPEPKGGGMFRSSPLTDGRQLAYRTMDNITDTFNMIASGTSQSAVISSIQKLQRLLEKAVSYWTTGWQKEVVWIEAQEPCDNELRYAPIVDYRLTGFGSPYKQPFYNKSRVASEAILVIEHKFWQDTVPGDDGNCVELRNRTDLPGVATYDSGTFEPAHSLADETYSTGAITCNTAAPVLGIGYASSFKGKSQAGIVFENVTIPVGAVIKSAVLRVTTSSVTGPLEIFVKGQSQEGGGITSVTLVDGGHGYTNPSVEVYSSTTGVGSGAVIVASMCDPSSSGDCTVTGEIFELTIVEPGSGYVNPYIVITDHGCTMPPCGSGAIATCTAGTVGSAAALFDGTTDDFLTRPRTRNESSMVVGLYTAVTFDIPVSYVVREITGNPFWSSGDNLALFISAREGTSLTGGIEIKSFDSTVNYPQLLVEWSATSTLVGRSTTCAQEVFVANKHNKAPIKYIFYKDEGAGTWSSNLFEHDYSAVQQLLPATPQDGDALYFGSCPIDSLDLDYGPFCSLVLDIYDFQTGITDGAWEYWDSVQWSEFDIGGDWYNELCSDNYMLDKLGVTSLVWKQPSTWDTTTVNGVTGWWVRFHVHTANGGATPPYQWHRDPYTVINPYIDIDGNRVPGDIAALAKIKFDSAACTARSMNTLVLGLRSLSRGVDFDAYLNASDYQVNDGVQFKLEPPTPEAEPYGQAVIDDPRTPTGRLLDLTDFDPETHGDHNLSPVCSWQFSGDLALQYIGVYHAYLRCYFPLSAVGRAKLRLKSVFGEEYNVSYSDTTTVPLGLFPVAVDMGQFTIMPPYSMHPDDKVGIVKIYVEAYSEFDEDFDNSSIYDVVLIPADEWSGNFGMPKITGESVLTYEYGIEIDAISVPRQYRAVEVHKTSGMKQVVAEWSRIASSEPIFQANENQRLWFFQYKHGNGLVSYFENCGAVAAERSSRYLLMRGNE